MNDLITAAPDTDLPAIATLPTLKPDAYVAQVFDPFKRQLATAKRQAGKTPEYDITTGAGMGVAKELRAMFRAVRLAVENERKARKAPIIEIGKLLDTRAKELTADIAPLEDKYDGEIKAEEQRKEDEKQRKLAEERARVEVIENRIALIRNVASRLASADTATIAKEIGQWTTLRLDPADYQEYLEDALTAVNTTLDQLQALWNVADAREIAERKAEADRIELARLKAEAAEREKREQEAEAARKAEAAERERQEKAAADARAAEERARQKAADDAAAAQAKEMADLRAQLAALQKAAEPAPPPAAEPVAEFQPVVAEQPIIQRSLPNPAMLPVEAAPVAAPVPIPSPDAGAFVDLVADEYGVSPQQALIWLIAADFAGVDLVEGE